MLVRLSAVFLDFRLCFLSIEAMNESGRPIQIAPMTWFFVILKRLVQAHLPVALEVRQFAAAQTRDRVPDRASVPMRLWPLFSPRPIVALLATRTSPRKIDAESCSSFLNVGDDRQIFVQKTSGENGAR